MRRLGQDDSSSDEEPCTKRKGTRKPLSDGECLDASKAAAMATIADEAKKFASMLSELLKQPPHDANCSAADAKHQPAIPPAQDADEENEADEDEKELMDSLSCHEDFLRHLDEVRSKLDEEKAEVMRMLMSKKSYLHARRTAWSAYREELIATGPSSAISTVDPSQANFLELVQIDKVEHELGLVLKEHDAIKQEMGDLTRTFMRIRKQHKAEEDSLVHEINQMRLRLHA